MSFTRVLKPIYLQTWFFLSSAQVGSRSSSISARRAGEIAQEFDMVQKTESARQKIKPCGHPCVECQIYSLLNFSVWTQSSVDIPMAFTFKKSLRTRSVRSSIDYCYAPITKLGCSDEKYIIQLFTGSDGSYSSARHL